MTMNVTILTACLVSSGFPLVASGNWEVHAIDDGLGADGKQRGADGVRLLDVNGDGLVDIACGWEEAGESRAYLHPGYRDVKGEWPAVTVGRSGAVEDAVFCDLDNDGAFDVISCSESREIYFHWAPTDKARYLDPKAWETVALPSAKGVQNWMISVPLQIDGEHGVDIVAAGKKTGVFLFTAPADPRQVAGWKTHQISDQGGWTMGLQAVDMDGDGDHDLLLGIRTRNPGVKWLENPGAHKARSGPWKVHDVGEQGQPMGFVDTGDLDGDGITDAASPRMTDDKLMIFRGKAKDGTRWEPIAVGLPGRRNKGVALGDIDLDGQPDLAVTREFAEAGWLGRDGTLADGAWCYHLIGKGGKFDDATLHDLDGDGDLDFLTTDEQGLQVLWFENPARPR